MSAPVSFSGIQTTTDIGEYVTTNTSVPSITIPTTNIPIDSNILWGAAATAMVGATLADWQRKREEEERARREREAASNAGRYAAIAKAYNASRKNFTAYLNKAKEMGMSDAEVAKLKKNVNDTGKIGASLDTTKGYIVQKQVEVQAAEAAARVNYVEAQRLAATRESIAQEKKKKEQAAFDHRMDEHTGEQNKVDAWYDQQEQSLPWWQKAGNWYQENVEKFVRQPPPFLSVSYQARPFDPKNLFIDEMIYPQFSARNGFQTWVYQSLSVSLDMTSKLTSNPSGWVDLNFSNGRITFKGNPKLDGSRVDYFIQPFALSVGRISSIPIEDNPQEKIVNVSTFDFDVLSVKNWMSLKVSQSIGTSTTKIETLPTGETIAFSDNLQLQTTVNIHRWPRIVAVAGAVYYVWGAAGVAAALKALSSAPLVQQAIQAIP